MSGDKRLAHDRVRRAGLGLVASWWQREDPSRTLRFDTYPFAGCSGLGQLDLSFVRLPKPAAF